MNDRELVRDTSGTGEALAEGGTWLLDLIAAVDHFRRGIRPGLTVWDALEEALRWRTPPGGNADDGPVWGDPDPLRTALGRLADNHSESVAAGMQMAVRRWVQTMATRYNDGHYWPHPTSRRLFPPPLLSAVDDEPPDDTPAP